MATVECHLEPDPAQYQGAAAIIRPSDREDGGLPLGDAARADRRPYRNNGCALQAEWPVPSNDANPRTTGKPAWLRSMVHDRDHAHERLHRPLKFHCVVTAR